MICPLCNSKLENFDNEKEWFCSTIISEGISEGTPHYHLHINNEFGYKSEEIIIENYHIMIYHHHGCSKIQLMNKKHCVIKSILDSKNLNVDKIKKYILFS